MPALSPASSGSLLKATTTDPAPSGEAASDLRRVPDRASGLRWDVATIAVGIAFLILVGWHGTVEWRVTRMALVIALSLGALWIEHRDSRWLRGICGLTLGLIGTSAGIGIGFMHFAKSDHDVIGFAGLAALVAGLYLLVAAFALIVRVMPGWWRLLAIPLALVLFQFALEPLSLATYGTNLPNIALGSATPADRGLPYQNVRLTTAEGVHLAAWYIPSHNGAAVVLLHGAGSTRTSVLSQATVLARHGFGVLLVDARGHGQSGGDAEENGWWGNSDTAGAVTWLEGRPEVLGGRVAVLGESMGGEEAIGAAGADHRIRAVVAEGAIWRGAMDDGWLPHSFTGYVDRVSLSVQTALTGLLTSAPTPPSLASSLRAAAPRPVLMIAGKPELTGDQLLRQASPTNVRLWELPDTAHTAGLATHPALWESHVIGFLNQALQVGQ
jgi:uncharacterized protein